MRLSSTWMLRRWIWITWTEVGHRAWCCWHAQRRTMKLTAAMERVVIEAIDVLQTASQQRHKDIAAHPHGRICVQREQRATASTESSVGQPKI